MFKTLVSSACFSSTCTKTLVSEKKTSVRSDFSKMPGKCCLVLIIIQYMERGVRSNGVVGGMLI